MEYKCPGAANMRTPTLSIRKCPKCGAEVELFSIDFKVDCLACGQSIFNNVSSCIEYCEFAEKCLGPEVYARSRKVIK